MSLLIFSVDFIKFFQSEDDNSVQDNRSGGAQNDNHKTSGTHDTSVSVCRVDQNNLCLNIGTTLPSRCPDEMDLDSNMSWEQSDVRNSSGEMHTETSDISAHCNEVLSGGNLSSDVSAIYLAMQHSNSECVNDAYQESISNEVCVEAEDGEEIDDFDPYLFIKNLPDLSSVVPTFRPMLLPKRTRSCPPTTLVLDLDGKRLYLFVRRILNFKMIFLLQLYVFLAARSNILVIMTSILRRDFGAFYARAL